MILFLLFSVGSADHVHRADQEQQVQLLAESLRPLRPGDGGCLRVDRALLSGPRLRFHPALTASCRCC